MTYTLVNKTNMINQFHKYNSKKRSPHFLIVANQGILHRILEEKKAWHRVSSVLVACRPPTKHISHLEKCIFSNFFLTLVIEDGDCSMFLVRKRPFVPLVVRAPQLTSYGAYSKSTISKSTEHDWLMTI